MDASTLIALIAGTGLLGGIGLGIKALIDNKALGANATAVVTAAARELVDPLRKELAAERADHAQEVAAMHAETVALREELHAAREDVTRLRAELSKAWTENTAYRARIRSLENGT